MKRWVDVLLLVALAALPFHRPALHTAPNVGAGDAVAGLALVAYLLQQRLPSAAWWRVGVVAVTLAPSLLVAPDRTRAALQLAGLVYVFLFSGAAWSLGERRQRDGLRALVIGAAVACALGFAVWQRYFWMAWPRPIGPTESPAMLSMIALGGLFALRALGQWRLLSILFWAVLVAAQSRILLCAIAGVTVEAMIFAWPRRRVVLSLVLAGTIVAFTASLVYRLVPVSHTAPYVDLSPTPYRVCHKVAWRAFADHPLRGVGLRGFQAAWPRYVDEPLAAAAFAPMKPWPRDPHGTIHGYLAEAGLPALFLLGYLAWDVWRRRGSPGYFVALVLASCTLDLLTERSSWALLGLISAGYHWPSDASTKR